MLEPLNFADGGPARSSLAVPAVQAVPNSPRLDPSAIGRIHSQLQGVSLVPVFTYLAVGVLVLIAISIVYLLYLMSSRPNSLSRDPDSLGQVMTVSQPRFAKLVHAL
jgi:hypothetical protein